MLVWVLLAWVAAQDAAGQPRAAGHDDLHADFDDYNDKEDIVSSTALTHQDMNTHPRVRRSDERAPRTLSQDEIREVRGVLKEIMAGRTFQELMTAPVTETVGDIVTRSAAFTGLTRSSQRSSNAGQTHLVDPTQFYESIVEEIIDNARKQGGEGATALVTSSQVATTQLATTQMTYEGFVEEDTWKPKIESPAPASPGDLDLDSDKPLRRTFGPLDRVEYDSEPDVTKNTESSSAGDLADSRRFIKDEWSDFALRGGNGNETSTSTSTADFDNDRTASDEKPTTVVSGTDDGNDNDKKDTKGDKDKKGKDKKDKDKKDKDKKGKDKKDKKNKSSEESDSSESSSEEKNKKKKKKKKKGTTTTEMRTRRTRRKTTTTTTPKEVVDIDTLVEIIANLTMDYELINITDLFNKTLLKYNVPKCIGETTEAPSTTSTTTEPPGHDLANATIVSKCFVCGLDTPGIPRNAYCADAFAGDFLPLVPVDPMARGQIARYRKYCRYLDIPGVLQNETQPRSVYGRFTGGCSVRWIDLSGVYTQRTCRNRRRAVMGTHFVSKRMAKLEMALQAEDNGCIISPMSSLVPLSRGISLYARFHACVCTGNWCNMAAARPAPAPVAMPPFAVTAVLAWKLGFQA